MQRTRDRVTVVLMVAALAAGCGGSDLTDTGYVGTWSRGNETSTSTISIARVGDEYLFRWQARDKEGRWQVRSTWDGHCEELLNGEKVADYRFRTWIDPDSGLMRVEAKQRSVGAEEWTVAYVDELVLARQGMVIKSFNLEWAGNEMETRPLRVFEKISDDVLDPPPPGAGAG